MNKSTVEQKDSQCIAPIKVPIISMFSNTDDTNAENNNQDKA